MIPRKPPIIRTDKWNLVVKPGQKVLLRNTVTEFRSLVRALVGVIYVHWADLGKLSGDEQIPAVERLIHETSANPEPKYRYFNRRFHKFPSYYRRGAIQFALGQVSSFVTRYNEWQSGIRKSRKAKPPKLTAETNCYPPLYKGQCIKFADDYQTAEIKVFTGSDWIWVKFQVSGHRQRHLIDSNKRLSPYLVVSEKHCQLSVPFHCHPAKRSKSELVVAVDLGINTTATVAVVASNGTVIHREFIHSGRDIDRRDQRLQRVRHKARCTGRLSKGFCASLYRKARNINQNIAHHVSKRIVQIAQEYDAKVIVFEHLKGWRAKAGRKGSTLKQRFHGWLHRLLVSLTTLKWEEVGGSVEFVNPAYTSKAAYDGSGWIKRDSRNYALAVFPNGRKYNADLNGVSNIAARYWHRTQKLSSRNGSEVWLSKSSLQTPRIPVTLSVLWSLGDSNIVELDTSTSR
jgi:putative transposase